MGKDGPPVAPDHAPVITGGHEVKGRLRVDPGVFPSVCRIRADAHAGGIPPERRTA